MDVVFGEKLKVFSDFHLWVGKNKKNRINTRVDFWSEGEKRVAGNGFAQNDRVFPFATFYWFLCIFPLLIWISFMFAGKHPSLKCGCIMHLWGVSEQKSEVLNFWKWWLNFPLSLCAISPVLNSNEARVVWNCLKVT